MRRKLSLGLMLCAWLFATGSQWDLVQTFAWGRMITSYSRSMPVLQAVKLTFSGNVFCGICETVQDAHQRQDAEATKVPGTKSPEKFLFVSTLSALVIVSPAPQCVGRLHEHSAPSSAERPIPPLPPPRAVA